MSQKKSNTKRQEMSKADKPEREQVDQLAQQIAAVLNNPLTPASVYNALADAVTDLYLPKGFADQPEYLGVVLRHHFKLEWREKGAR